MSEEKNKFKATCYLTGYGSWTITVHDGAWRASDRIYTIIVRSGRDGSDPISNKTYRFPVESTILVENR